MNGLLSDIFKFLTNRIFLLLVFIVAIFIFLVMHFFNLQIVNRELNESQITGNLIRKLSVKAPRGEIFDRLGRPLAENRSIFVISINRSMFDNTGKPLVISESNGDVIPDPKLNIDELNMVLLNLVKLLEENGETFIDDFPITKTEPFEFTLKGNKTKEKNFIEGLSLDYEKIKTADQVIEALSDKKMFNIPKDWSAKEKRDVLSLRSTLYRYKLVQFKPIILARDVSEKTVAAIEEESLRFHGISIETESLREYPDGIYFSHIIGYMRKINEATLKSYKDRGYTADDLVGETGIELSKEFDLRGIDGELQVEVNYLNKNVGNVLEIRPIQGKSIYLTIDKDLQIKLYKLLEEQLEEILINKINGLAPKEPRLTEREIIASIVRNKRISMYDLFQSDETSASNDVKEYILSKNNNVLIQSDEQTEDIKLANEILLEGILNSNVGLRQMLLVLYEQDFISDTENFLQRLKNSSISISEAIIIKIKAKELTPHFIGIEPFSGSIVITNVNTGEVYAAVSYPSYDNNRLMSDFNNYWPILMNDSLTTPINNRAFNELRAPGSTFKMVTAAAGLETDTITPSTEIYDNVVYKEAGPPFPTCWSSHSHGSINITEALEVSCNYFFFDTSFKLRSSNPDETNGGIKTLNKYMIEFGLNQKSGVEIGEGDIAPSEQMKISSPELKRARVLMFNKNAPESELRWLDGNTIATSIGQFENAYSAAVMAKYGATIATKGERYKLTLIDKIRDFEKNETIENKPVLEHKVELRDSTWNSIYKGMELALYGDRGTAKGMFDSLPVRVAGKTGTAEENKNKSAHTTFLGFAPAEKPEISIYVIIPFGDTKASPAAASQLAEKSIAEYIGINAKAEFRDKHNSLSK